jgi:excisionase family DNA binding protein
MDVAVIAEGVETREQARWLRHLGIKLVQGFAFGRPAPAAAIETLLRDGLELDRLALAFEPIDAGPDTVPAETRGLPAPASAPGGATVTLGEAAVACGVSASTVRRWADTGRIAVVRTSGGHRRFPVAELRRLNGEAAANPGVRPVALPADALPALGELLATAAGELSAAVTRGLYDGSAQGWFGSVPGREQLGHWSAALAGAARRTDYDLALDATRRLVTQADLAGASLLERHTFLERYGEAVVRALRERHAPREELVGARRLFARLRQVTLEAADARAAA